MRYEITKLNGAIAEIIGNSHTKKNAIKKAKKYSGEIQVFDREEKIVVFIKK